MSHTRAKKQTLLARVRRIAGQISAIERAVQEEADCSTLLHQTAGVRGAINGLLDEIIADHLMEHVARPELEDSARRQGAEELLEAIRRYSK